MYSPAEATNSLPFSSPYPAIPGPLLTQIKMEIIYYIMVWFTWQGKYSSREWVFNTCIKPSSGVRGQESLEGGGQRREDRERGSHCLSFILLTSPFHPETPDTQADVQWIINDKLVIQIMQSVKFGTQTPRAKQMYSQKSLSCQRYQMKHCLESVL